MFIGYFCVFLTYALIGTMGYIGFNGTYFDHAIRKYGGIDDNCLNMFPADDAFGFFIRFAIFAVLFTSYPIINYFTRSMLIMIIFKKYDVDGIRFHGVNTVLNCLPLIFSLFYPNIGHILDYAGAIAGFLIIYILPNCIHIKYLRHNLRKKE